MACTHTAAMTAVSRLGGDMQAKDGWRRLGALSTAPPL
jgi:hypothetical protein